MSVFYYIILEESHKLKEPLPSCLIIGFDHNFVVVVILRHLDNNHKVVI